MQIKHTWQAIILALLTEDATLTSLSGRAVAQLAQSGKTDAAPQKFQTTPAISAQEKLDYSQKPFAVEHFATRAVFQNDGTNRADLEVVVNVSSDEGASHSVNLFLATIPAIKNWKPSPSRCASRAVPHLIGERRAGGRGAACFHGRFPSA
jgi:hypothetical protein